MRRLLTGLAIAASLGLGFALPLSASGSDPSTPVPAPRGPTVGKQAQHDTAQLPHVESAPLPIEGIAGGYVFVPISPYRTYDSRNDAEGFLVGDESTFFEVLTDANLSPKIPAGAVAVSYNLTVVDTFGSGYLGLYPANVPWPGTSSINWSATGQTVANGGVVALGNRTQAGQIGVYCGPAANLYTDFLIDITGYYI